MTTFGSQPVFSASIFPNSIYSIGERITTLGGDGLSFAPTSTAWPSGSLAIHVPFYIPAEMSINSFIWLNGATISSNIDMGIYTSEFSKVFSLGPQAQSGAASSTQLTVVSPPLILPAGMYYLSLAAQATTTTIRGASDTFSTGTLARVLGMYQSFATFPLPQSILSLSLRPVGQDFIPWFGIGSLPGA